MFYTINVGGVAAGTFHHKDLAEKALDKFSPVIGAEIKKGQREPAQKRSNAPRRNVTRQIGECVSYPCYLKPGEFTL